MTAPPDAPATGSAGPDPTGPTLRFQGGAPTPEEIAAVTAALLSLRRTPAPEPGGFGSAPRWSAPVPYRPPGSWAAR